MWVAHPAAAGAIKEGRKYQTVAVAIGAYQQHGSTDGLQANQTLAAQIVHVLLSALAPGIAIEGCAPRSGHAMRMDYVADN